MRGSRSCDGPAAGGAAKTPAGADAPDAPTGGRMPSRDEMLPALRGVREALATFGEMRGSTDEEREAYGRMLARMSRPIEPGEKAI